jgi:hypothetical protein
MLTLHLHITKRFLDDKFEIIQESKLDKQKPYGIIEYYRLNFLCLFPVVPNSKRTLRLISDDIVLKLPYEVASYGWLKHISLEEMFKNLEGKTEKIKKNRFLGLISYIFRFVILYNVYFLIICITNIFSYNEASRNFAKSFLPATGLVLFFLIIVYALIYVAQILSIKKQVRKAEQVVSFE